ncbi:MAG: FHA domain-containing protein [Anaerolineae bacterium]|jgi:hypothetical protein
MKVRLICQEGPGAGDAYSLDPDQQTVYSVGRSSECDLVLKDQRSSRHHADIRWTGGQWQVVDRGSTNGSFVNGLQVHRPYELRPGDRLTIGETTMVVQQEQAGQPRPRPEHAPAAARPGEAQTARQSSGLSAVFWLAQGLVTAAVICLAAGAFLPWIEITGSLSRDLQPLVQGIADLIASLSGQDSLLHVSQRIGGLDGYGKLTLGIAAVSALALVVDIFFYRRSVVPAVVYLGTGIVSIGAMGFDLANYYRYYQDLRDLSLLFGIRLGEVVQVFDHFIEMEATPMPGLFLTGAGLLLLLAGGIGRLVVAVLGRRATP